MRIGVFSDVHGNWEALETVLKALKNENTDRLYCAGDIVGYGPDPNRCAEEVTAMTNAVVAGNHDWAVSGRTSAANFNEYANIAVEWTKKVINDDVEEYLRQLPIQYIEGDITLVHGTPEEPEAWNYLFDITDAHRNFKAMTTPICFVGHSHVPVVFIRDSKEKISVLCTESMRIEEGKMYLINIGSVGQPRDGDPRAAYGILDTDENIFRLKRIPYPVDVVQHKMRRLGLPFSLINRLGFGE